MDFESLIEFIPCLSVIKPSTISKSALSLVWGMNCEIQPVRKTNNNMNPEFDSIIDTLNSVDFPILLGIFGFISAVIIWGIIKNR